MPDEPYAKDDVREYLLKTREKCRTTIESLTDARAHEASTWGSPYLRLQLMSMRHTREHASQLSLYLGQNGVTGMDWVAGARA